METDRSVVVAVSVSGLPSHSPGKYQEQSTV